MIRNLYSNVRERLRSLSRFGAYDGMMIRVTLGEHTRLTDLKISWSRSLSNDITEVMLKNGAFQIEAPARGLLQIRLEQDGGRICRIFVDGRCISVEGRRILAREAVSLLLDLVDDDPQAFEASTERIARTGLHITVVNEPVDVVPLAPTLLVPAFRI